MKIWILKPLKKKSRKSSADETDYSEKSGRHENTSEYNNTDESDGTLVACSNGEEYAKKLNYMSLKELRLECERLALPHNGRAQLVSLLEMNDQLENISAVN